MTTAALPVHYGRYLCRSFLHVAGAAVISDALHDRIAALVVPQLTVRSPANIRIHSAFGKARNLPHLLAREMPGLKIFYSWQMTIGSLSQKIFYDWFSKIGLHFKQKQRVVTQRRLSAERDARMTVRVK
jgi:hypothetical protein